MAVVIDGTTGIDKVQDGSIQTADLAANAVTAAKWGGGQIGGRRNLIINGAMEVAQRSTSVSGLTSTGYHTIDRIRVNGSGGTYNQSQQTVAAGGETGLPSQFTNFLRHECTAGNDNHILMTRNEDVRKFTGTMKASFYAKGTNPTTPGYLSVKFHQSFGSGGSGDVYTTAQNFTLTSTWQRFEFDIEMPSLTGKTIGTGSFGGFLFGQDVSTSTDAWTLDITGIQWEHGDTATPFEHRSYGEELKLCKRYFQKYNYSSDTASATTANTLPVNCCYTTQIAYGGSLLQEEMRTSPTFSGSAAGDWVFYTAASSYTPTEMTAYETGPFMWGMKYSTSGTWTAGNAVYGRPTGVGRYYQFDAEL